MKPKKGLPLFDLTGQLFGRLEVIGISELQDKKKRIVWDCVCECGKKTL